MVLPWVKPLALWVDQYNPAGSGEVVIYFHVVYNLVRYCADAGTGEADGTAVSAADRQNRRAEEDSALRPVIWIRARWIHLSLATGQHSAVKPTALGMLIEQMLQRFDSQLAGKR